MEFWAVEVKGGEPFKVELHEKRALHLSQACIGEVEKGSSESVCLFVNVNGKKLVLGTLNTEKLPQQTFDLVFDKTFELYHNWKNESVFFHGYTADNDISDHVNENDSDSKSFEESSSSESDEDVPAIAPNGGPASEVKQRDLTVSEGKDSATGKQKVKVVVTQKDSSSEDSDDDDDATSSEDDPKVSAGKDAAAGKKEAKIVEPKNDSSDDDNVDSSDDDSDDSKDNKSASDEDSDSDEDEVTPVQVKSSKKRAAASVTKKHVPEKKAKLVTPPKTDGKMSSVHVATPYPGKTPASKPNQQTPKTEGSHPCKSCKRTFKSNIALESHTKAKHSGGK